eukprot:TRINITY_DN2781_c0_g1_i1.p1 TRINITY_DN2781_c0_g1~~TRINITY_DN2781_c0_g1_i1.p1  ORF type:complete len:725 (-),score=188.31 TRINITY_DN2781_c0_g1_i1:1502-3463(-)
MPRTTVAGHSGNVILGELTSEAGATMRVLCFSGRVHSYEGWSTSKINFLARLAMMVGCKVFILTNSAGGCLKGMTPGSIMVIRDYIRGTNTSIVQDLCEDARFGPRYLKTKGVFSDYLAELTRKAARDTGIEIHEGTYCWTSGPTYETPAEVRAGIKIGAGAFGMSTVPEVLASVAVGMELFAISLATNLAAGLLHDELTHEDVTKVAREAGPKFERLLLTVIKNIDTSKIGAPQKPNALACTRSKQLLYDRLPSWPSVSHVFQDVEAVKSANLNQEAPAGLIFSFSGERSLVSQLEHVRVLPLSDLTNFSAISQTPAAIHGKLVFGTFDGARVLVVSSSDRVEGFNDVESFYLVALGRFFGAQLVCSSFPVIGSVKNPCLVIDIVDRSRNTLPPNFKEFVAAFGGNFQKSVVFDENLGKLVPKESSGAVMYFPGPAMPTPAEVNCVSHANCSLVGITNIHFFHAASALGLSALALVSSFGYDAFHSSLIELKDEELPYRPLLEVIRGKSPSTQLNWSTTGQPVIRPLIAQEKYESVERAASFVMSKIGSDSFKAAVVADAVFGDVLLKVTMHTSFSCALIPGWLDHCPLGSSWTFSLVSFGNSSQKVALVHNSNRAETVEVALHQLTFAVRVSQIVYFAGFDLFIGAQASQR